MFGRNKTPVEPPTAKSILWNKIVNEPGGLYDHAVQEAIKAPGEMTLYIPWSATGGKNFSAFLYDLKENGHTVTGIEFNQMRGEVENETEEQLEFAKRTVLEYFLLFPRVNLYRFFKHLGVSMKGATFVTPAGQTVHVKPEDTDELWFTQRIA